MTLWTALQHLVWQKDCKLVGEMHACRDEMCLSEGGQAACEVESFGSVFQTLGPHAIGLAEEFPVEWADHVRSELDLQVFPHLMCLGARASMSTFRGLLHHVCPSDDPRMQLLVGPVKKPARIAVKVKEYTAENEGEWPFICKVLALSCTLLRDMLRACRSVM